MKVPFNRDTLARGSFRSCSSIWASNEGRKTSTVNTQLYQQAITMKRNNQNLTYVLHLDS